MTPKAINMSKIVKIDSHDVGQGQPVFVIAEAGVNHNGSKDIARQLIEAAAATGADCVKFQTFKAERVATAEAPKAAYQLKVTPRGESQIAMLKSLELDEAAYPDLISDCARVGLVFMSTPYNEEDVDFLVRTGVPALKLSSIHAAEPSLLRYAAATQKPIILSTGMCTMDEVKQAVEIIWGAGNDQLIVLQCTTNYPSPVGDTNLHAMNAMRDQLGVMVGYSDHTQSNTASIAAVALGACVIEKHFTLDKTMLGPDQLTSLEPKEMSAFVKCVRDAAAAMGDGVKQPLENEARNIEGMRRGIVARQNISIGSRIEAKDLILKRPLSEIPAAAWDEIVGAKAARNIENGKALSWADVQRAAQRQETGQ